MANVATITAKTGPAIQATAQVITGVTQIEFDLAAGILQVTHDSKYSQFALTGSNTITLTASAGAYTLTVA